MDESYEVYAIRYGHVVRRSRENFIDGDPHDVDMPMSYFVWAIVGGGRTFVLDTGFNEHSGGRRGRQLVQPIADGLAVLGIRPDAVEDVIISHLHYDHAGNNGLFANARFHLQDTEMAYATGRCMCHHALSHPFEADDVVDMVRRVFDRQVCFHDGTSQLAPGLSVHLIGGHSKGLQAVRVRTRRGWVVLASDASHFYANFEQDRAFPVLYSHYDVLAGFDILRRLATSDDHVVPGHDPLVLEKYPAAREGSEDWVVRLDADPKTSR